MKTIELEWQSISDKYRPAMEITEQITATEYFERCVIHCMQKFGKTREEAEKIERANLAYFAGWYGPDTRERVERLFACVHPIFGAIATQNNTL